MRATASCQRGLHLLTCFLLVHLVSAFLGISSRPRSTAWTGSSHLFSSGEESHVNHLNGDSTTNLLLETELLDQFLTHHDNKSPSLVGEEDDSVYEECVVGTERNTTLGIEYCLPISLATLPRHSNPAVNSVLEKTESMLYEMHINHSNPYETAESVRARAKDSAHEHERIYANNYVNLGKIDT